jgi:nitroimidazol reductase NimA-like FMN-containing flavoprotein (pyridoxamine 5'-phosphate oxidase superfamily)
MSDEHRPAELHDLDRGTCLDLLASQKVGRLVLTGGQTTVAPVNFVVAGGAIVIRADARSHGSPPAGTAAAFEIDAFDVSEESGWSVVVRGRLEDITDTAMDDADLQERLRTWAPGPKDRWLRVTIDDVSGRWLRGADRKPPLDGRAYL